MVIWMSTMTNENMSVLRFLAGDDRRQEKKAMEGKNVKIISPENVFLIKELRRVRLSDTRVFFDDDFSVCSARVFGS